MVCVSKVPSTCSTNYYVVALSRESTFRYHSTLEIQTNLVCSRIETRLSGLCFLKSAQYPCDSTVRTLCGMELKKKPPPNQPSYTLFPQTPFVSLGQFYSFMIDSYPFFDLSISKRTFSKRNNQKITQNPIFYSLTYLYATSHV